MRYPKLVSLLLMITIFGSVGGVAWAIISSHAHSEFSTPDQIRDAAMLHIKTSHPETAPFMDGLAWTGGRQNSNGVGAETYSYRSGGWNLTINYPVVANAVYSIRADYSALSSSEIISVPYRIIWQGNWQNGEITETEYTFAQ